MSSKLFICFMLSFSFSIEVFCVVNDMTEQASETKNLLGEEHSGWWKQLKNNCKKLLRECQGVPEGAKITQCGTCGICSQEINIQTGKETSVETRYGCCLIKTRSTQETGRPAEYLCSLGPTGCLWESISNGQGEQCEMILNFCNCSCDSDECHSCNICWCLPCFSKDS